MKRYHPVTKLFPPMSEQEYIDLKASIAAIGQRVPILTWKDEIIDGVHRDKACSEIGLTPLTEEWDGKGSLVETVVALNKHRRHMSEDQRVHCAAEVERELAREAKELQRAQGHRGKEGGSGKKKTLVADLPQGLGRAPLSRDKAAESLGVKPRRVQEAKRIMDAAPDLHEKVKNGDMTHAQAKREVQRQEKREALEAKAATAAPVGKDACRLIHGDCLTELPKLASGTARLVFADPPYNIGVDYGGGTGADKRPDAEYLPWCKAWMYECRRLLTPDGSFWVLIGDEYAAEFALMLKNLDLTIRSWVKWYETFGVNCSNNFNRCSRHLFYCVNDAKRFVFNADAVTRPSDRQAKYQDGRADPGGKLWDNVWQIPRLVGTAKERIPDFPTQLPLALLNPIVLCVSEPGDLVVDPFAGSATTGEASLAADRRFLGIEQSADFVRLARLRLKGVASGG